MKVGCRSLSVSLLRIMNETRGGQWLRGWEVEGRGEKGGGSAIVSDGEDTQCGTAALHSTEWVGQRYGMI